jgi:hypothetical protein
MEASPCELVSSRDDPGWAVLLMTITAGIFLALLVIFWSIVLRKD